MLLKILGLALFLKTTPLLLLLSACQHDRSTRSKAIPIVRLRDHGKIQKLDLESYIQGVLAGEMSSSWPEEALKAQAIAARTYAIMRMSERKDRAYNLTNSINHQVFKRKSDQKLEVAVRETRGMILTFDNRPINALFHSTCGGHTTDAKSVWGGSSKAHLKGVVCGFCRSSPHSSWSVAIPLDEFQKKFSREIKGLRILNRSSDGHVTEIQLMGPKPLTISGNDLRMRLGPMRVKSTLVKDISMLGNKIQISGRGFGHGLGMCQYGAKGMAKAGKVYSQILYHYYPGTTIKRIY